MVISIHWNVHCLLRKRLCLLVILKLYVSKLRQRQVKERRVKLVLKTLHDISWRERRNSSKIFISRHETRLEKELKPKEVCSVLFSWGASFADASLTSLLFFFFFSLSSKTSSFIVTFFHFTFVLCLRLLTFFISSFTFVLSLVSWHSLHIILFLPEHVYYKRKEEKFNHIHTFPLLLCSGNETEKKSKGEGVTFTQESHASTLIVFQSKKRWDTLSCLLITFVIKFLINKTS